MNRNDFLISAYGVRISHILLKRILSAHRVTFPIRVDDTQVVVADNVEIGASRFAKGRLKFLQGIPQQVSPCGNPHTMHLVCGCLSYTEKLLDG